MIKTSLNLNVEFCSTETIIYHQQNAVERLHCLGLWLKTTDVFVGDRGSSHLFKAVLWIDGAQQIGHSHLVVLPL